MSHVPFHACVSAAPRHNRAPLLAGSLRIFLHISASHYSAHSWLSFFRCYLKDVLGGTFPQWRPRLLFCYVGWTSINGSITLIM